jgi:hypothetical protein
MFKIHAEPTSLSNLHRHYFGESKGGLGVCGIRWDLFGLALLHGGPYGRVLVGEQGSGLLVGGVLQRNATAVSVVGRKKQKGFPIVEQLNLGQERVDLLQFLEWNDLTAEHSARYDNLLLMGNYDFLSCLTHLQQFLFPGAILAFLSRSLAPLEQTARHMLASGYLSVHLYDSWSRQYQVLKNRTHPMMSMDSASGYLLTAIKGS